MGRVLQAVRRIARRLSPSAVFGIPFALSLTLSAMTVGNGVFWQDSGFFLTAVREIGVLYPPGFVTYVVLCKAWTLLLFFLDFTMAVNLFSSACAALSAGTIAVATRDLLATRGPIFRVCQGDAGALERAAAIAAGCLCASGYTYWFSGIYAKGYALYYLTLSLLLLFLIRADASRAPGDFTLAAALVGLAWAAHPSAALLGIALIFFAIAHRRVLGTRGILGRAGLAAGCALGPSLLLPVLAARQPALMFGNPETPREWTAYVLGLRFVGRPDVFGWDFSRWRTVSQYFWEEFLGVGLLAATVGLARLASANRRLLWGMTCWIVPFAAFTTSFKIEGQHDHWLVAAWMPLYLVAGLGFHAIGKFLPRYGIGVVMALGAGVVAWAIALNHPLLNQRGYALPELFGRVYYDPIHRIDREAIAIVLSDDAAAIGAYLQRIRGEYPGIRIIRGSHLESDKTGRPGWYDDHLRRRDPTLRIPEYGTFRLLFGKDRLHEPSMAAFANANASRDRPIFFEVPPPPDMIREDYILVPAGALWKLVPRENARVDLRYWDHPIRPEEVRPLFRRARGQQVKFLEREIEVRAEPYERRLLLALLRARAMLADLLLAGGQAERARKLLESIALLDPETQEQPELVFPLAMACFHSGNLERAERLLGRLHEMDLRPGMRATAHIALGDIYRAWKRASDADHQYRLALQVPGLSPDQRKEVERKARER